MKLKNYKKVCAIVPCNFYHKAGDGISTRKHGLKDISPTLQSMPGSTQMTYILECKDSYYEKIKFSISK